MNIGLRIGLDIDDCLADFWGAYYKYFDTDNNPKMKKGKKMKHELSDINPQKLSLIHI